MIPGVDPLDLVDPARYARNGYPHALWSRLRAEAPVAHFAPRGYRPFWAITKHADVVEISSQPLRFSNAQGILLGHPDSVSVPSEMVVMLDPPRHGPMRAHASPRRRVCWRTTAKGTGTHRAPAGRGRSRRPGTTAGRAPSGIVGGDR